MNRILSPISDLWSYDDTSSQQQRRPDAAAVLPGLRRAHPQQQQQQQQFYQQRQLPHVSGPGRRRQQSATKRVAQRCDRRTTDLSPFSQGTQDPDEADLMPVRGVRAYVRQRPRYEGEGGREGERGRGRARESEP